MQQGMKNVLPINTGGSVSFQRCNRYDGTSQTHIILIWRNKRVLPVYAGEAAGYIFDFLTLTILSIIQVIPPLMSDMKLIQRGLPTRNRHPFHHQAILRWDPKEAAYAVQHLLNVQICDSKSYLPY